jgi:GT2 family glycosyltransferase
MSRGAASNVSSVTRISMQPELAIVIPTYNRPDLLTHCLETVRRFAPPRTEILVVDDASPDGCGSRVARSLSVPYLRLHRRKGFCYAANTGIRSTRASVIEVLNDDTTVSPGWANAALERFRDPSLAGVAPLVLMAGRGTHGRRIDSAGDRYYAGGIAAKREHGENLRPRHLHSCEVFGASASSAFYRREALRSVGAFPDIFGAYFEDVDLAFRLHRAGYSIVFEPRSRVYHRMSASYGRPNRRLLEQQSHNEERVFWRNLPAPVLRRALARHIAVLAAKAWRRWQEGNLAPFVAGRMRVLGEVPDLLRHRQLLHRAYPVNDVCRWQLEWRYWTTASSGRCGIADSLPDASSSE